MAPDQGIVGTVFCNKELSAYLQTTVPTVLGWVGGEWPLNQLEKKLKPIVWLIHRKNLQI